MNDFGFKLNATISFDLPLSKQRCLGESCTISLPKSPAELPLFDFDLLDFLDLLGVENAVKLFVCALLEHQVSELSVSE